MQWDNREAQPSCVLCMASTLKRKINRNCMALKFIHWYLIVSFEKWWALIANNFSLNSENWKIARNLCWSCWFGFGWKCGCKCTVQGLFQQQFSSYYISNVCLVNGRNKIKLLEKLSIFHANLVKKNFLQMRASTNFTPFLHFIYFPIKSH